ncbi:hypothetical protein CCR75_000786 [Bremia lactucae]|uniref:Uncharacterized protein n=1 Tax=Bremia lactucae TaxID=4779 RepID=A0A976IHV4_BRELC|nr:hypothetical protein CCR75_000786 [Bremia lactucae]
MSTQHKSVVRCHVHAGSIYVAELCRPSTRNAFNDAMYEQLTAALKKFEADDSLHAFVLTGHGDYFTSGADMNELAFLLSDNSLRPFSQSPVFTFLHTMLKCKKLLVAAVNGPAVGIGVTMLMHFDLVYAAASATFWTPFLRAGIMPEFASSYTFPHFLGPTVAANLLIRSKVYNAQDALLAKLVGSVVPTHGFLNTVLQELTVLVTNCSNKKLLPLYKSLLRHQSAPQIQEALDREFKQLDHLVASGDLLTTIKECQKQLTKKSSKL